MRRPIHSIADARARAKRRMPRLMFDYIDGAAGEETAAANNAQRFRDIRLLPRSFKDINHRDLSATVLGQQFALPFGIAPMGMCALSWHGADKLLAEAAVARQVPIGVSTAASASLEDMCQWAPDNAWFQLYVGPSIDEAMKLVERAKLAGYKNLILTVDAQKVARRSRDIKNGFQAPLKIGPRQFIDLALHPEWSLTTLIKGKPELANFANDPADASFTRTATRGLLDATFLKRLRDAWSGNLIVKGITTVDNAQHAVEYGADAVYLSNHGGRQLDSAVAPIDQLSAVRAALPSHIPVFIDSGVRSGDSIVKALARGADFVFLGRPFLYAIGASGAKGLSEVFDIIEDDISTVMAQVGCSSVAELDEHIIFQHQN